MDVLTYAYHCMFPNPDAVPILCDYSQDSDLEDDVDAADKSTQTPTTADPSYQSHGVKSMERGGFTSRVRSVVVMVKQRELHGRLEEVIQPPGRQTPVKESMFVKGLLKVLSLLTYTL